MPVTTIGNALAAYNAVARAARGEAGPSDAATSGASSGADFAGMLRDSLKTAIDTGKTSERLSEGILAGQGNIADVVMAANNAQLTLQTVVAIRDKVINAYNQIMQMPI